jgi:IMP dehydrogenase
MKFLNGREPEHDLTYSDVFLVPTFADISSRSEVDLTTPDEIGTTMPIVVANMTAVAGRRMAETVARRGGVAIFPQDIPASAVADMTAAVKGSDLILETPITLEASDTINDAMNLIYKRSHGAVIIVDTENRPIGIFTATDAEGWDRFAPLHSVMTPNPIVLAATLDPRALFDELTSRRLHLAPVVSDDGRLAGVITERGALRATVYSPAVDASGRLLVGAAIGVNGDVAAKTRDLIEVGVDLLVVDTAHGHQQKMLDALGAVRSASPHIPIVAGNVVTAAGTKALINAGADIVKVGVGPGAMCTTRMMTGVGRPQFSAVQECAATARSLGKQIWADGGVRHPRDVALALAAGAGNVMIGSWFAGTFESAADTLRDADGRLYKENYGMASARAVSNRSRAESAFDRAHKEMFEEGISHSRMYLLEDTPSVEDVIDRIVAGVRSACTYAGARTIDEFHQSAVVGVQSTTGYAEGLPQGTSW